MMKWAMNSKIQIKCLPASWLNKASSDTDLVFQFCLPYNNEPIFMEMQWILRNLLMCTKLKKLYPLVLLRGRILSFQPHTGQKAVDQIKELKNYVFVMVGLHTNEWFCLSTVTKPGLTWSQPGPVLFQCRLFMNRSVSKLRTPFTT